jgi:Spy/CpxP family protein refolding chaperone
MVRLSALVLSAFLSTAASAQIAPAPAAPNAPALSGERREITPEQRARFSADRKSCVDEVKPQSLPRGERRRAMQTCMEARNPELKQFFARGESRRAEMRQVRSDCRNEVRGKSVPRAERQEAMKACVIAKKPEMAKVFTCVDQARAKNLQPGSERRDFMRTCLRA